uniref:Uncharacterized protein n=1 Tax=Salix viminalis TaxID=40686 RepID=A0A6N2K9N6_SALVM
MERPSLFVISPSTTISPLLVLHWFTACTWSHCFVLQAIDYFVSAGIVTQHEQVPFELSSLTFTWILSNLLSSIRSLQLLKKSWTSKLARNRWAEDSNVKNTSRQLLRDTAFVPASFHLHRDPNVWSNPDEYIQTGLTGFSQINKFRGFSGITFALQVLHLTLARLLQGFSMTTPIDGPVDMTQIMCKLA